MVVIGLTLGPLVDRLSRRRPVVVSGLVQAATFVALPFVDRPGVIVALAMVNGVRDRVLPPGGLGGLPVHRGRGRARRGGSIALLASVEHVAWTVGPLLAGVLLATSGTDVAYW